MKRKWNLIYWIATIWLALGMLSTGIVQLIHMQEEVDNFTQLGYPIYLMTILGICKIMGVVAILIPKFLVLKEWAYAGFFYTMTGAIISHIIVGDSVNEIFPPLLLLVLTLVSWYFRPLEKKLALQYQN
ncbi:MAG: DoxX family protein [Saprospiraceae bacterium]|nr:DoxX family protein [Saprospiraceae bacterium]MBK7811600.1 DoxX family protein [Saprospiraceae bacterium]MBK9631687.1 DoxX family protein [Saprospiraceae bacterium]